MGWMEKIAAVAMVSLAGAAVASAQSFQISQNGKSVGTANLQLSKAAAGFTATSTAKIDMPGLKYSFNENQSLDASYHLTNAQLKGLVNGSAASVNTTRAAQQFVMKINANSNAINTPLTFHPLAVFFPDFDPAALQVLLNLGAAHNNSDIWALVPKQSGSITALRIATDADMKGTLDGNAVAVHHFTVTYDANKTEVFSGPANDLLQVEWTSEGFAMVRQGFKLTPPAHPGAPPPQQPAQPQGQTQPQGQAPPQPQPQ